MKSSGVGDTRRGRDCSRRKADWRSFFARRATKAEDFLQPRDDEPPQTLAHPHADQSFIVFMAVNISDIGGFGLFTVAGYFLRRKPASHKRMMMLAMVAMADSGFSRITGVLLNPFPTHFLPNLIATFYGNFLQIGLMAGWDLWRRAALRPRNISLGIIQNAGCAAA